MAPGDPEYIHAYRTVTGVDLSPEATGPRVTDRYFQPSVHLRRRLEIQHAQRPAVDARIAAAAAGRNGNGKRPAAGRPSGSNAEMEFSEEFE